MTLQPLPPPEHTLILVVDDLTQNLRVVGQILKQAGYAVAYAQSGPQALEQIRAAQPHLVLLDLMMPQMSGLEVCQRLRQDPAYVDLPVIFLTASQEREHLLQAFASGAVDYLTKPFSPLELLARVRTHLELQHSRDELKRLVNHIQQLNAGLTLTVEQRTDELQRAIAFESTLKRITDKVRDSLDEGQIVDTAVRELMQALPVDGCNAGIYDPATQTSVVKYECTTSLPSTLGKVYFFSEFPELYTHLHQGNSTQFCWHPVYFRSQCSVALDYAATSVLICPIRDNQGTLGDVWVYKLSQDAFDESEVHLIQHVATQCAIAIRQARLYREAQMQIVELERLNRLKGDFLGTISHELRTPMANIEMVIEMLSQLFAHIHTAGGLNTTRYAQAKQYFQVLQGECEREMGLINDLLDLVHLDAETEPLLADPIDLHLLIPHVAEGFLDQMQQQHLRLNLHLPADPTALISDSTLLRRILTELLTNACKYTPPGEVIEVRVSETGDRIYIEVTNSGVDLPKAELERIFDVFYRVPDNDPWKHGGTGLGLALVKKQVQYLGGAIAARCANGRFTISLHLPQRPPMHHSPSQISPRSQRHVVPPCRPLLDPYCTMG